jgi:hypothetical protein
MNQLFYLPKEPRMSGLSTSASANLIAMRVEARKLQSEKAKEEIGFESQKRPNLVLAGHARPGGLPEIPLNP